MRMPLIIILLQFLSTIIFNSKDIDNIIMDPYDNFMGNSLWVNQFMLAPAKFAYY